MAEFRARFPSAYSSVGAARRAICTFAEAWFEESELRDIALASGEALANCAEHGHRDGGYIEIFCRYDGQCLTIDVKDGGVGFESENERDRIRPSIDGSRGFGIHIMRELMDLIEYADHGTSLRLTKRKLARNASDERIRSNAP